MIKNYKIQIDVLAPLFVGNGTQIQKAEYIQDRKENRIYVMDTYKMYSSIQKLGLLEQYEKFVMTSHGVNLYNFVRDNKVNPNEYKKWAKYSYSCDPDIDHKSRIDVFVKDAYGLPYLPGSSFKGAISNALLNVKLLEKEQKSISIRDSARDKKNKYLSSESRKVQELFLYKKRTEDNRKLGDATNSIMRGLRVSDSEPLSLDNIILCQKVDVARDNSERRLPIFRECIKPNTKINLMISVDTDVFPYDGEKLEEILKLMYKNISSKFLSNFPNIQNEMGTLVYLGGGTGFVSKTAIYSLYHDQKEATENTSYVLDYLFKEHKHNRDMVVSPRMRKCTKYNNKRYDMGLCRVHFEPI